MNTRKPRKLQNPGDSEARIERVNVWGRAIARPALRFGILFLLLLGISMVLSSTSPAERLLHEPLSALLTQLATVVLSLFGQTSSHGTVLVFNSFSATVEEACDGVLPSCIFLAAVLAFPSRAKQKVIGVGLGITSIFLINLLRLITLMIVGAHWPSLFESVHIYVWQALVIFLSLGLWVFWVEHFVRRGTSASI